MNDEKKPLNPAEALIVGQMRKWPTLYRNARQFFHGCIVSHMNVLYWKDGLLVVPKQQKYLGEVDGNPQWGEYEDRIPEDAARDLMHDNGHLFVSVHMPSRDCPAGKIPDDAHESWLEFIDIQLYRDSKLVPELYARLVTAYCILLYVMPENPRANMGSYQADWECYHASIPSMRARINFVREQREMGKIPERSYVGMGI